MPTNVLIAVHRLGGEQVSTTPLAPDSKLGDAGTGEIEVLSLH